MSLPKCNHKNHFEPRFIDGCATVICVLCHEEKEIINIQQDSYLTKFIKFIKNLF